MNIGVVGLGLIGGSFCKAIRKTTEHKVFGLDTDTQTLKQALETGAITGILKVSGYVEKTEALEKVVTCKNEVQVLSSEGLNLTQPVECKAIQVHNCHAKDHDEEARLCDCDVVVICLSPVSTVRFIQEHVSEFRFEGIVMDVCGVKEWVMTKICESLRGHQVYFVGGHPMAGRESSGFGSAVGELFVGASLLLVPFKDTPSMVLDCLRTLAKGIGFTKFIVTTAKEHDQRIAYTSQLAHVVSCAYVKSPTIAKQSGFSAGSFQDMTRVATVDEKLWAQLFLQNKGNLCYEITKLIDNLSEIRTAIEENNTEKLETLLKEGKQSKLDTMKV